jgi:hypothetical protein
LDKKGDKKGDQKEGGGNTERQETLVALPNKAKQPTDNNTDGPLRKCPLEARTLRFLAARPAFISLLYTIACVRKPTAKKEGHTKGVGGGRGRHRPHAPESLLCLVKKPVDQRPAKLSILVVLIPWAHTQKSERDRPTKKGGGGKSPCPIGPTRDVVGRRGTHMSRS